MSTVAKRGRSSGRGTSTPARTDALADGRAGELGTGVAPGVDGRGSHVEGTLTAQSGQVRRFKRGCWYCGQLGHKLSECWIASAQVDYGTETPWSLCALAYRERGR